MQKFIFLKHTADIKFQAFGATLEKAFENSALALAKSICSEKIKSKKKNLIQLQAEGVTDNENLLKSFLEEFLYLFETENFLVSEIKKLEIEEKSGAYFVYCEMFGDDAKNYEIDEHVKAITYNEMFVKKIKNKFVCQVVLDV